MNEQLESLRRALLALAAAQVDMHGRTVVNEAYLMAFVSCLSKEEILQAMGTAEAICRSAESSAQEANRQPLARAIESWRQNLKVMLAKQR